MIHGLHGEQDLRKMGGLAYKMPITPPPCGSAALGLAGVPPLAGFFSKDEILAAALDGEHTPIFLLLVVGAFLTAFYTFRLLFLAFSGSPRMSKEVLHHVHESPWVMTVPLVVLSLLTAGGRLRLRAAVRRHAHRASPGGSVFAEHEGSHSAIVVLRVGARVRGRPGAGHVPLPDDAGEGRHGRAAPARRCTRC